MTTKDIDINARKKANVLNPKTNRYLEIDIWIPSLRLCFEFQVNLIHFLKILLS